MTDINKEIKLDLLSITILIVSGIIMVFSFISPMIFVQHFENGFNFTETGQIGDTIGGIMNPFIAISGVFITFLAFYIQFKANKLQSNLFRLELDYNKFENQFYEMLKLHKDNVNEIQIDEIKLFVQGDHEKENIKIDRVEKIINGRKSFDFLKNEFEIIYQVAKVNFPDKEPKIWINEAYGVFFIGLNNADLPKHNFFKDLREIKEMHSKNKYTNLPQTLKKILNIEVQLKDNLRFELFEGHSSELAHYYRHLFQTVKFVVNQKDILLDYSEKRKYLRILRAQLSNHEQVMLFYNWLSSFGKQWNNETNKFFTDYRMIHNIHQGLIVEGIKLEDLFNTDEDLKKEKDRKSDPLFEFDDWE